MALWVNMSIAVLLFLSGIFCIIKANYIMFDMIGEINRKLPEADQIPKAWRYPGKDSRVQSEYRRLYPEDRLSSQYRAVLYSGVALLFLFTLVIFI
jgi:hypothetical protein